MRTIKLLTLILLGAGVIAIVFLSPAPAAAQTPCGDRVVVQPGDTLSAIARRCGTTIQTLMAANPSIDPNVIRVGMVIHLRPAAAPPPRAAQPYPASGRYVVRPGDSLFSIARAHGVRVPALIALNPQIDPRYLRPGDVLLVPGGLAPDLPRGHVAVAPSSGGPGSLVRVSGSGFEPRSALRLMVGPNRNDLTTLTLVQSNRRGEVDAEVSVPQWAQAGTIVFALAAPGERVRAVSEPFRVTSRHVGRPGLVHVDGTLIHGGVECPLMRGDDGRTYTLLGELHGYRPGDRVRVEGRPAEMSICMQGTALEIRRIAALQ